MHLDDSLVLDQPVDDFANHQGTISARYSFTGSQGREHCVLWNEDAPEAIKTKPSTLLILKTHSF